jgi:hypothetical protein
VWSFFRGNVAIPDISATFSDWFYGFLDHQNASLPIAIIWWLWKWRNQVIFEDDDWSRDFVLRNILKSYQEFHRFGTATVVPLVSVSYLPEFIVLRTDGSWSSLELRMGGGGGFFSDSVGRWIQGFSCGASDGCPLQSELLAIGEGLRQACELGYRNLLCEVDCSEAINLITTSFNIDRHQLRSLIGRLRSLLDREWTVSFNCIPRERNQVVDCLAKFCVRDNSFVHIWKYPPS